jgi:conjugal transfer pilus assembly protein TraD
MPSSQYTAEGRIDAFAAVDELLHWFIGALVGVLIGALVGLLLARWMRKKHLHWSWTAIAFGVVVMNLRGVGGVSFSIAVATLRATWLSRRWHREDLESGADRAEIASARHSPRDAIRSLLKAARIRYGLDSETRDGMLLLGYDERARPVAAPFAGRDGGKHALVLGATGSGKTVTQTTMATQAIQLGMGVIVLDPKGDCGMRDRLKQATETAGRAFLEWTPAGPLAYNPFAHGGETEIADKALAGEHFTEPHYQRQAQRYMGHVVRALRSSETEVGLRRIVELMEPEKLEELARGMAETDAERTFAYLDSLGARQRTDLAGVRDRLAILVESDVGRWLDPQSPGARCLDLPSAVRSRATVYFSLESDSRPLVAEMLGAAIVQDLQTTIAALQGSPIGTLVVIDEFSAISAGQVVRLFGRARSAGFNLLLGTQELSDLRLPGREHLLEQVMGNLSVLIAHRQVVPASAELVAALAGTRGAWKVSHNSDGRATRTRAREAALDPTRIMDLGQGCAAVIVPGDLHGARITRIRAS